MISFSVNTMSRKRHSKKRKPCAAIDNSNAAQIATVLQPKPIVVKNSGISIKNNNDTNIAALILPNSSEPIQPPATKQQDESADRKETDVATEPQSVKAIEIENSSEKSSETVCLEDITPDKSYPVADTVNHIEDVQVNDIPYVEPESPVDPNIPVITEADLSATEDRPPQEILKEYGFIDDDSDCKDDEVLSEGTTSIVDRLTADLPPSPYQPVSIEGMIHETFVPEELKKLKIWVCRCGKRCWSPNGQYIISPTAINETVTYDEAKAAVEKYGYDGVSIMLMDSNDIWCVDIDHCNKDGKIHPVAWSIIQKLDSWTEESTSGSGFHIYVLADKKERLDWGKKKADACGAGIGLEIYPYKRQMVSTGRTLKGYEHIRRADKELEEIYNAYMAPSYNNSDDGVISEPPPPMTAEEVLEHMRKDKNGAKFIHALESGDISGFDTNDRSSIDFSVISKLCFYCIDPDVIREILLNSRLRRDKWDTMRGNVTYLDYIIAQALQRCTKHYHPSKKNKQGTQQQKQISIKSCDEEFGFSYEEIESNKCNAIYLSELFAKCIQGVACYSTTERSFLIYTGKKWDLANSETEMARLARKFIKRCCNVIETKIKVLEQNKSKEQTNSDSDLDKAKRLLSYYQNQVSYGSRMKLIADVKDILAVDYTKFDAHPDYINLINGTLNLTTMQLQPHSSTDLLTQVCDVEYDPSANNERFSRFIDEICCTNQETKRYLQKVCGYLLHGANEEHALWIAFGPARNGKSTLMGVLRKIMGDFAVTADVDILTKPSGKSGGSAKPEILLLNKKRFIFMSEADKYSCLQASLIKQITGADNLSARGVYSNNIREFRVYGKIIIACNNLPKINDMSLLASDRINILPFDRFFKKSERDTTLETQFLSPECKSAIFNWMLKGISLYREEGLKPTARMQEILEEYERGYDIYAQFIQENLRLRKDNNCSDPTDSTLKAVWETGKKWLKDNNYYVPTRRDFISELKKSGIQIYRKNNQAYIQGFVLNIEGAFNTEYKDSAELRKNSNDSWHKPPHMQ